jgi:hypothetical protein
LKYIQEEKLLRRQHTDNMLPIRNVKLNKQKRSHKHILQPLGT